MKRPISLRGILTVAAAVLAAGLVCAQRIEGEHVETAPITWGELSALFRDNSQSPRVLSGIDSLFHRATPSFDAYDPDSVGASAGMNFEHIISGMSDPANRFLPRYGRYALYKLADGRSVVLRREREDCPWDVSSTFKYTMAEPHYIDVEFRCTPHNAGLFGQRGYAIFFFANYMNDVAEIPLHFRGVAGPGSQEQWIAGDAPEGHADWNGGGTYRNVDAKDLAYDDDHNFKLNVWSYDYPRYVKPFYYGRAAHGMVFMLMFDKAHTPQDEIRLSLFKFKAIREVKPLPRPAWDFQYVIHRVDSGREYGFNARVVWKKFVSPQDCLDEYTRWSSRLP